MKVEHLTTAVAFSGIILMAPIASARNKEASKLEPGSVLRHENLTVVSLHRKGAEEKPEGNYLTLEQASNKGLVEVTELDGNTSEARVEQVEVTNKSEQPLFLMAGEIILGGKQDRVISRNTVVPAQTHGMRVDVFCVERGRWSGETAGFEAAGEMGHSKLRQKAQGESQEAVWDEVAETNRQHRAQSQTGSYRASLNESKDDEGVSEYVEAILPKLRAESEAVGIAVAIDGRVVAVDAFANPKLFARAREKLLRSYALEAASSGDGSSDAEASKADVEKFLERVTRGRERKTRTEGDADNTVYDFGSGEGTSTSVEGETVHQFYRAY